MGRRISTARIHGTCLVCEHPWVPGQRFVYTDSPGWCAHPECLGNEETEETEVVSREEARKALEQRTAETQASAKASAAKARAAAKALFAKREAFYKTHGRWPIEGEDIY